MTTTPRHQRPPNPLEAQQQFMAAIAFLKTGDSNTRGRGRPELDYGEFTVSTVNTAFACELFLKSGLKISGIPYKKNHGLKGLFDLLPQEAKDTIKMDYLLFVFAYEYALKEKTPQVVPIARISKRFLTPEDDYLIKQMKDFDLMLTENDQLFAEWRYNFETTWEYFLSTTGVYGVHELCDSLHEYILDQKPEWQKLSPYPKRITRGGSSSATP